MIRGKCLFHFLSFVWVPYLLLSVLLHLIALLVTLRYCLCSAVFILFFCVFSTNAPTLLPWQFKVGFTVHFSLTHISLVLFIFQNPFASCSVSSSILQPRCCFLFWLTKYCYTFFSLTAPNWCIYFIIEHNQVNFICKVRMLLFSESELCNWISKTFYFFKNWSDFYILVFCLILRQNLQSSLLLCCLPSSGITQNQSPISVLTVQSPLLTRATWLSTSASTPVWSRTPATAATRVSDSSVTSSSTAGQWPCGSIPPHPVFEFSWRHN